MTKVLRTQGERLHEVFAELVRAYQFRDREQTCFWGLSISQCYALEVVFEHGPITMSELAHTLFLEASTVTRIIDRLVAAGLVERTPSSTDRRVCRVSVTDSGRQLVLRIRDALIDEHVRVLRQVPAESREAVITALDHLLDAFRARQTAASSQCGDTTSAPIAKVSGGR